MSTITPNKTQGTSLISLQSVAASSQAFSSAQDVSTKFAATVFIHFGRRSTTAAGAGVNFRIEAGAKSSPLGFWFPLTIITTAFAATTTVPITSSSASGQKVISATTTTNAAVGSIMYIDDTTIANSEWVRIASVQASTSMTCEDNLLNTHATSAVPFNAAEEYAVQLDLSAVGQLRVVADGSLFTQAFACEVWMVTEDSLTAT